MTAVGVVLMDVLVVELVEFEATVEFDVDVAAGLVEFDGVVGVAVVFVLLLLAGVEVDCAAATAI